MKTIGLIGGMSWESTLPYYKLLNEGVKQRLGGLHSAKLLLYSVDFAEISALQHAGDWDGAARLLAHAAQQLQNAGADFLLLCTNTMHKVAPQIEQGLRAPLLHIADPVAAAIRTRGLQKVILLGTRFTMEERFYRDRLAQQGLQVLLPNEAERQRIHDIIYKELCLGVLTAAARTHFQDVIARLVQEEGAQGAILGCTEIGLVLQSAPVPLFDSMRLHVEAGLEMALAD
ncbi:aspartate/glutamate racemase family protein [Massilia sp. W12]|uniref:aspartate/glutamate racemase family protein n=1 Tax=Massilia sp. W12 TaxID=3126507 RepID=UPI0030D4A07B